MKESQMDQETEPLDMKQLAGAVILNVICEFAETFHEPGSAGINEECHRFLTGQAGGSRGWFEAAGIPVMPETMNRVYERIRKPKVAIKE
jgi:hypothetical protein